jgi:formylglycine-generating enzyme required for sulfatase activity
MISSAPVPAAVFEEFLAANSQWRPDQREALVEKDLVTGEYLLDSGNADDGSITAVSWYAARAFCAWLSERLPASMADYEVRLPTEAEWEYAAKSADPGARFSAFWEWCADPYAPLAFIRAAPEAIAAVSSPERAVRGGSRLNPAGSATVEIRASLPPDFCSPFVSFRPVIAPKGSDAPFGSGLY